MTVGRLSPQYIQTLNTSAKSGSGSRMEFFVNNTTTTKQAWLDEAKANSVPYDALSNEYYVISDAEGIFPVVYLDGVYRITITNGDGVTVFDQNDVSSTSAADLTEVTEIQAANVSGIEIKASDGTVIEKIANIKTLRKVKIEDYASYVGDGVASDKTAWLAALADMKTNDIKYFEGNGGVIYLPDTGASDVSVDIRDSHFYMNGTTIKTPPVTAGGDAAIIVRQFDNVTFHDFWMDGGLYTAISSISVSGTVATVTTAAAHGLLNNTLTYIDGVLAPTGSLTTVQALRVSEFNGRKLITSVPTTTTFTFNVQSGTPTSPVCTYAKVARHDISLNSPDGIRMFRCNNIVFNNPYFLGVSNAWIRYTGSTDTASITSNPTAPVNSGFLTLNSPRTVMCGQFSATPAGTRFVNINNILSKGNIGGAGVKIASRLDLATTVTITGIFADQVKRFDGTNTYDSLLADYGRAFQIEGVSNFNIDVVLDNCQGDSLISGNVEGNTNNATNDEGNNGYVKIVSRNCGDPLSLRRFAVLRMSDTEGNDTNARAFKNIKVEMIAEGQRGNVLTVGNNVGIVRNMDVNIVANACSGGLAFRLFEGGDSTVKVRWDGTGQFDGYTWVTGTTYKVQENIISDGKLYRCDGAGAGTSTSAPSHTGTETLADGYTWKFLSTAAAVTIDADESPNYGERIVADIVTNRNTLGVGTYISKIKEGYFTVSASDNDGVSPNVVTGATVSSCQESTFIFRHLMRNTGNQSIQYGNERCYFEYQHIDGDSNGYNATYCGGDVDCTYKLGNYYNVNSPDFCFLFDGVARERGHKVFAHESRRFNSTGSLFGCQELIGVKTNAERSRYNIMADTLSVDTFMPSGSLILKEKDALSIGEARIDEVVVSGVGTTTAYASGSPAAAAFLLGSTVFTASCGWTEAIGAKRVWWVANFSSGSGNLAAEPAADIWGETDGATVNTNAHWRIHSLAKDTGAFVYRDFGNTTSPLWSSGATVESGDYRAMGKNIVSITGDGTTATATVAAAGDMPTDGSKVLIARSTGGFNSDQTVNDGRVTITHTGATTFTFPCTATGAAGVAASNPSIIWSYFMGEMVAPNQRTTGSTMPTLGYIASGNWRLVFRALERKIVPFSSTSLPVTQCKLVKSGANLVLQPYNGNGLTINGKLQIIPSAGVSLVPSGLTSGTNYFIYAFMSSGTMTLEFSATAPVAQTGTGFQIKTGDATRSYVGIALASSTTTWSSTDVWSYYNQENVEKNVIPNLATPISTTSSTFSDVASGDTEISMTVTRPNSKFLVTYGCHLRCVGLANTAECRLVYNTSTALTGSTTVMLGLGADNSGDVVKTVMHEHGGALGSVVKYELQHRSVDNTNTSQVQAGTAHLTVREIF